MAEYKDKCPVCGGQIDLVFAKVELARCQVRSDGWDLTEAHQLDTYDEQFECRDEERSVPAAWVFGETTATQAIEAMTQEGV